MGYILQFPRYKYQQYHNRITKAKTNPLYVEKAYQTQTARNEKSFTSKRRTGSAPHVQSSTYVDYEPVSPDSVSYQSKPSWLSKQAEKVFAEMTGKGRHFNETV